MIQFGKCMEMMTGGRIPATPHKVTCKGKERVSIVVFIDADKDTLIKPTDFHPIGVYQEFKRKDIKDFLDQANTKDNKSYKEQNKELDDE